MLHLVAHTVRYRLLFFNMVEGVDLFHRLDRLPLHALCVMPDHVHVLVPMDVRRRLGAVLSGWARRRNALEGMRGALVEPLPEGEVLVDRQKQQRAIRYLHLNPTRAGLADDPLAWPLSTHRDACGLTVRRVGPARRAEGFHRYVSGDPTVDVMGTELPREEGGGSLWEVLRAVSAVTRTPVAELRGQRTRGLAVRAAEEIAGATRMEVAAVLRCHRATLYRLDPVSAEELALVRRVVGDPRFRAVDDRDLRGTWAWRRYLGR